MGKWEMVTFYDAISDVTKLAKKIKKENYLIQGQYQIIDQGKEYLSGYTNNFEGLYEDVPAIVFGDHTRILKYIYNPLFLGADGVKLLKTKRKDIDTKYAYYYLSSCRVVDTGYNRHYKWLKELKIPLPPLPIQQKIADILDRANALIEKRKTQITKLDLLVKSQFVEMFGDPVRNPMGWEKETLRGVSRKISDGPFGSNLKTSHYTDKGVRVIRLQNIGISEFLDFDKAFISQGHYETLKKHTCVAGDVIIGTLGKPNLRACILPNFIELAINKSDCVHFVPDFSRVNACFVCEYLNQPATLAIARGSIHGQTRSRISMSQVAALPIYAPPLHLQNRFADFVCAVDESKAEMRSGLDKLELLYKSLMQKCFKGEIY